MYSRTWILAAAFAALLLTTGCPHDDDDTGGDDDATADDDDTTAGDDDDTTADDDDSGDDDTTGSYAWVLGGAVREPAGRPVAGATVAVVAEGDDPAAAVASAITDDRGAFVVAAIDLPRYDAIATATGRATVRVDGLQGDHSVSFPLPPGDAEVELVAPPQVPLDVELGDRAVELRWEPTDAPASFVAYHVMSADHPDTDLLDSCVGVLTDAAAYEFVDPNPVEGSWTYRVYEERSSDAGPVLFGSSPATVEVAAADAFPERLGFVMVKTVAMGGAVFQNQARFVVATTSTSDVIPPGLDIEVTSPLLEDPTSAMYISPAATAYKRVEQYAFGDPAVWCGDTRKIDEWDAKYAASADDWADDAVVGAHVLDVGGDAIAIDVAEPMPVNRLFNVQLERDGDDTLVVTWDMYEDGQPFAGGAGAYGWKYLVKIKYAGAYADGSDPDYEWERLWSNWCLRDVGRDLGFNRVCELAAGMPQDVDRIEVPDGLFEPGDEVTVALYAISTARSTNEADAGVAGYGQSLMYWLFSARSGVTVP